MVRQLHDARSWAFRLRLAAVCGKFGGSERSATAGPAKTARAGSRLPNLWGVGRDTWMETSPAREAVRRTDAVAV